MEYLGMKSYYIVRRGDLRFSLPSDRAGYETRMLTVDVSFLLYLADRAVPVGLIRLR